MSKAFWNKELFLVFFRKLYAIPFTIGFRLRTQIHSYIKNSSTDNPNEFALREMLLEMKAPKHSLGRHRLIILHKFHMNSSFFHIMFIVGLHKITTFVTMLGRSNDAKSINFSHIMIHFNLSHFNLSHLKISLLSKSKPYFVI